MNSHWALLKLLEKINFKTALNIDPLHSLLREQSFCSWDHIEEVFFRDGWFLSEKKETLKKNWLQELEKIKADLDDGIQFICWNDPDYPQSFLRLLNPPLIFSLLGKKCWQDRPCISIVGSREPHPYSVSWMKTELRAFLKMFPLSVVSGGARGVDFMAHSLSLDLAQPTLVILPSGVKNLYPTSLNKSLPAILEAGGGVLSEYDSSFEVRKHLFQHRNRLIAAMNHALLIVEAKKQSGTMMTAQLALEMSKPVWVVPGHPLMNSFAGSLELMILGGQMVRNREDLKIFFECELIS